MQIQYNTAPDTSYNGWTNYETWLVNLWITNDYNDYQYFKELVDGCNDLVEASQTLQDYIEEGNPLNEDSTIYTDLLRASLGAVNWFEIAQGFTED